MQPITVPKKSWGISLNELISFKRPQQYTEILLFTIKLPKKGPICHKILVLFKWSVLTSLAAHLAKIQTLHLAHFSKIFARRAIPKIPWAELKSLQLELKPSWAKLSSGASLLNIAPWMRQYYDLHRNCSVPLVTYRKFQSPLFVALPLIEDFPVPKSPNYIIDTVLSV